MLFLLFRLLPLPVNSYCFFRDFFQVSESHCHWELTAGGSSVRVRHTKGGINMNMASTKLLPYNSFTILFLWYVAGTNFRIKKVAQIVSPNLEDFSGNSSSSSSKGPTMSGSSLCCDARKLNISKVAFLIRETGEMKIQM